MTFAVVSPRDPIVSPNTDIPFILRQDNWNDYGFQTLYQLYHSSFGGKPDLIGDVKILRRGQTAADVHQLSVGVLNNLTEEFCSVGQSLDYYERLANLSAARRLAVLDGLRDAIRYEEIASIFRKEPGWNISLFRNGGEDKEFNQLALTLLTRDYGKLPKITGDLTFEISGWSAPFKFQFDAPEANANFSWESSQSSVAKMPRRIAVLIGRNGSGKSTLLARLARVAHASTTERKNPLFRSLGTLTPEGIGFTRVLTVSYSAFDSFQVPGITQRDREQLAKEIEEGTGRYIFCGLRDIARELRENILDQSLATETENVGLGDRQGHTLLKPIEQLAKEFSRTYDLILGKGRFEDFRAAMMPILEDSSFNNLETREIEELLGDDIEHSFMSWSTGHKIVIHTVASLIANVEPKSVVLFDEPETHLHPPMLAALMHAIRKILEGKDSFAIIATHSPVVLQETLARHVYVIQREGSVFNIARPSIQTFGENIGSITSEIFNLNTEITDYHSVLRTLVEKYKEIDEIEAVFDGSMSMQARAFIMNLLANKKAS